MTKTVAAPLVSIVITSFNRANFIEKAIESAIAQDYTNLEIIISDNCSTDSTDEIIKKYLPDPRVKFFKNESNVGIVSNFKISTEQRATGDYVTYISSDDYLINNSFVTQAINIVNKYENVLLVFGKNKTLIDKKNEFIDNDRHELYEQEFKKGIEVFLGFAKVRGLGWGGVLIKRKELNTLNAFDLKSTSIDYAANLTLMLQGNVGFIKDHTYVFRVHDNQTSPLKNAEKLILNFHYLDLPYSYAIENKFLDEKELNSWKDDILLHDFRYASLQFLPVNKAEYEKLISYFKLNHPRVYLRLKKEIKWNILNFFFSRPHFSLKFFKIFSEKHYKYLNSIVNKHA